MTANQPFEPPRLANALPLNSETAWSNLLAALIDTDPEPLWRVLNIDPPPAAPDVAREVALPKAGRLDVLVRDGDHPIAVIEAKVLAGFGRDQLARYEEALPNADRYLVVHPERLPVDVTATPSWRAVPWETLLNEYSRSDHTWVAATAQAWTRHLDDALPKVDRTTVWNALVPNTDFVPQMTARISWLHSQVIAPDPLWTRFGWSSAGVSATFGVRANGAVERYTVMAEVEERLPVRNYPKVASTDTKLIGPSIWVGLLMSGIESSSEFDWMYLLKVWNEVLKVARSDWSTRSAVPRAAHDREGHRSMKAAGGPSYLGVGFGAGQVKLSRSCMFGARIQLQPTVTLEQVAAEMTSLRNVVKAMAAVRP